MSLNIIQNTVEVPENSRVSVARTIIKEVPWYFWGSDDDVPGWAAVGMVFHNGKLWFDPDMKTKMDYLTSNDTLCKAIAKAGATGRLTFGTIGLDTWNQFWGVEFGFKHYRHLRATTADINWKIGTALA